MAECLAPGVYVQEIPTGGHPIEGVSTSGIGGTASSAAFIDIFQQGPLHKAVQVTPSTSSVTEQLPVGTISSEA
jgi:phage tail sheath protein FI